MMSQHLTAAFLFYPQPFVPAALQAVYALRYLSINPPISYHCTLQSWTICLLHGPTDLTTEQQLATLKLVV